MASSATRNIVPEDFGYHAEPLDAAHAEDAAASASIIREVFAGRRQDVARRLIVVNGAAALYLGGAAESSEGVCRARRSGHRLRRSHEQT